MNKIGHMSRERFSREEKLETQREIEARREVKLIEQQYEFLSVLAKYTTTVGRRDLPLADRQEDKVRQACRRLGLVKFGKWEGDRVMGWKITDLGRAALEQSKEK